jgi:hypothetical protein
MTFRLCRSLCRMLYIMCLGGNIGALGGIIRVLRGGIRRSWPLHDSMTSDILDSSLVRLASSNRIDI